jgi:hypothetical protein
VKFVDVVLPEPRRTAADGGKVPELLENTRTPCRLCGAVHTPAVIEIVRYADEGRLGDQAPNQTLTGVESNDDRNPGSPDPRCN